MTHVDLLRYNLKKNDQVHVVTYVDPEGEGTECPCPLKNHKNIGLLSNTGQDPQKITALPSQHSMLGHHWHASSPAGL